jgi:hypothetical protein
MAQPVCPACGAPSMVEISLTLAGRRIVMQSCARCEHRSWQADGRRAGVAEVLAIASETRR